MEVETVSQVVLAVAVAVSMKEFMEPMNVRKQLARLHSIAFDNQKEKSKGGFDLKPSPVAAFAMGAIMLSIFTAIAYFVVGLIDPEPRSAIIATIVVLLLSELMNGLQIDRVHFDIRKMIDKGNK
jgi:hypothetical protein